jgi:hypothetical protein
VRRTPEALSPLLLWAAACVPEGPRGTDEVPDTSPIVDVGSSGAMAAARVTEKWSDHFDRAELGSDWLALSPEWHLDGGKLCGRGAKNHGVWLQKRLPRDVRIEIDAIAGSDDGDLKVEVFGDGRSGATGDSYDDATGYVAILGGWKNTLHVLARLDEHGDDRLAIPIGDASDDARARRVVPGHPYRFVFERRRGDLRWLVDGTVYFDLDDAEPLAGVGHDHFGLNDWDAPVCFDNLEITPL